MSMLNIFGFDSVFRAKRLAPYGDGQISETVRDRAYGIVCY